MAGIATGEATGVGLLLPEAVKRIRKRFKLTRREAGTLIGSGPDAFQKYESGDILVSKAITSALILLDRNPGDLELLRSRARDHHAAA